MHKEDKLIEKHKDAILALLDAFEKEDKPSRERFIPKIRKNLLYWRRIQDIFWDERSGDFRNTMAGLSLLDGQFDTEQLTYNLNITRAHGESVIAALGVSVPNVKFMPDDADNANDLAATDEYDNAVELLSRHNNAGILLLQWLFIYYNQGLVATYNYHKDDNAYGTYKVPIYDKRQVVTNKVACPECDQDLGNAPVSMQEQVSEDPMNPMVTPIETRHCEVCKSNVQPIKLETVSIEEYLKEYETRPKGRECVEVYGPLNVIIPLDARKQQYIPYLIFEEEIHPCLAEELYPAYRHDRRETSGGSSNYETFYAYARRILSEDSSVTHRVTPRKCWFRPFAFNELPDDQRDELKKDFPKGLYACIINRQVVHLEEDNLDEHWTISFNPTSDYLQTEPPASDMNDFQELENDLANLTAMTIFRGIPQNFADPNVLDFDSFEKTENSPGLVFPAEARFGQPLSQFFHQTKTATLSREVDTYRQDAIKKAQFVSGDMPSIHGGANTSGSKTLGEYELSRAQALQRLGIVYKVCAASWRLAWSKATFSYCAHVSKAGYDDRFISKGKDGRSKNVNINHQAIKNGKVAGVEPETDDELPISWVQRRMLLMSLMDRKDPRIDAAVFHPSNIDIVSRYLGMKELHIPGREDVRGELEAIRNIIEDQAPIPIDPELDDPIIHAQVLKEWLSGPDGRVLKLEDANTYKLILERFRQYAIMLKMSMGGAPPTPKSAPAPAPAPANPLATAPNPLEVNIPGEY